MWWIQMSSIRQWNRYDEFKCVQLDQRSVDFLDSLRNKKFEMILSELFRLDQQSENGVKFNDF